MNSIQYQGELKEYIGDNRAAWLPDESDDDTKGANLKKALEYGLEQTHMRLNHNSHYKEQNHKRAELSLVNGEATLPTDYGVEYEVIDDDLDVQYDYRIDIKNDKIIFEDTDLTETVTLKYMEKETTIVNNDTEFILDDHFSEAVVLYGLRKYHMLQFDNGNAAQALAMAEDEIEHLIANYI